MTNVLEFSMNDPSIGLIVRSTRNGPELELTNMFLAQYKGRLSTLKRHYALFYEPLLPTGFPDIIVVSYNPKNFKSWNSERSNLTILDLKVLHHLYFVQGSSSENIENQLGIDSTTLFRVLERLLDSAMIRRTKKRWIPRSLRSRYAATNIQAIEAKVSDWQGVFRQASMNRWFASESCVLSPVQSPSSKVMNRAIKLGVGIYSLTTGSPVKTVQKPVRGCLPSSYASWMLNEWIGRRLFQLGGMC